MLTDTAIPGDRNMIKEDFKIQRPYNRNTAHVECKSKGDTGNNWSEWDHFKITQNIPEQYTRKPSRKGTTENSHIGHCTHISESVKLKTQESLRKNSR
jgi:hypothetical protein